MQGLAASSNDYLVALDTAGEIVWAEPELLALLGRAATAGVPLHVQDFLEGEDLADVAKGMGRLLSGKPRPLRHPLRLGGGGSSPVARVVNAWRLDFKDGASIVVSFLRLVEGEPAAA